MPSSPSSCTLLTILSWILLFSCVPKLARSTRDGITPPAATARLTDLFPRLAFDKGFSEVFGGPNVKVLNNGTGVSITLNKISGSGFVSKNKYYYGFFSAAIKLPAGYSAGVVVAFYMSNADDFPRNHDEIDFELLGHEKQKEWVLQTNVYGNGSVKTGREEKFRFWFDPTTDFHRYSILWNDHHIVFLVDNIPIREVIHNDATSKIYPSKPMSVYATIWDGSDWATHGGKKPVNYAYAPFVASFTETKIAGCVWNQNSTITTTTTPQCVKGGQSSGQPNVADPVEGQDFVKLSEQQKVGMEWVRKKLMIYSYCNDRNRYKVLLPECAK